jgi:hypothetical protein
MDLTDELKPELLEKSLNLKLEKIGLHSCADGRI